MPKLLTRKKDDASLQAEPCNFSDPSQNEFVEQQVSIDELKARCTRYHEHLTSLQPPQQDTMIRAANFTTDSVQRLMQQNPGSSFIRVYYGIDENGEHGLFMAPVTDAGTLTSATETSTSSIETDISATEADTLSTEDNTLYVDDCCVCPPRLNCPKDGLLEYQP